MRRSRKTKLITMIALVVAIVGMSIGFATFSRILTISSKATVDPNRDSHKLVIYGIEDFSVIENFIDWASFVPDFTKLSKTSSLQLGTNYVPTNKYPAIIDNSAFTISGISADFSLSSEAYLYYFLISNEGANDIYLADVDTIYTPNECRALNSTTQSLVDDICNNTMLVVGASDSGGTYISNFPYVIPVGDYIFLVVGITQVEITEYIDGPYEPIFSDVKLVFCDVLPEPEEEVEE